LRSRPMTQAQIRQHLFPLALFALITVLSLLEIRYDYDSALILYGILFTLITLDLSFWTWWGFASRERPTDIFIIIWLLMFSLWLVIGLNMYARYVFVFRPKDYTKFIQTDWWAYRVGPEIAVFVWVTVWIISKLFGRIPNFRNIEEQHRPRILIIEDEKDVSDVICKTLEPVCAYQIDVAYTVEEAKKRFVNGKYSCITVDLQLGGSIDSGVGLVKYIRENDPLVYIAVISGFISHERARTIMDLVDDFLAKPFDLDYLQLKSLMWVLKYRRRMSDLRLTSSLDLR
jgi:CheY-like chemotaxis protein